MDGNTAVDLNIAVSALTEDGEQEQRVNTELVTDTVAVIGDHTSVSNEACLVEHVQSSSDPQCLVADSSETCLNEVTTSDATGNLTEDNKGIHLVENNSSVVCQDTTTLIPSSDLKKEVEVTNTVSTDIVQVDTNCINTAVVPTDASSISTGVVSVDTGSIQTDIIPEGTNSISTNVVPETTVTEDNVLQVGAGVADGYIILSKEAAATLGMGAAETTEPTEPLPKRFRFEGEDGQSYVLTVTETGSTELHTESKQLSNIPTVLESASAASQTLSMTKRSSDASNDVSQSWFTTKDDKMALQSKGASWKQGQWTKDEIEILMTNINNYCKEHSINDPTEIIFEMSKDERKDFYRTVAKGLQRPLFSVYRRVTRMYDQKNHMGKYSPEEMSKLRELRMKFGNDWASIGASLGRSASSVKDKCRLMRDTCNSGKWLPEEERRLAEAVYEFAGIKPGQNVTSGLSWANVAERVATRSEKQCRTKWLNYLNWKQKGGTDWTREDDINLVLKIAAFNVSDDSEIDWNDLSKNWPSVRSPQWLRGKWWSLKRHVPDYQILPFNDLIEYLKTVHLRNVHMKYPLGGNFKVAKDNLTRSVSSSDMTFHIPVPLATTASLEGSMDSESFQAYEVLHQTGSGAYLITQPQNNPAISISGATLGSDHIIVHSLPTTNLRGTESMAVQMNTTSPVIISSSTGETVPPTDINTISIQDVVAPSQEDLQGLNENEITAAESSISQSELDTHNQLHTETNIISDTEFNTQTITGSDIVVDSEVSGTVSNTTPDTSDLVMVSSSTSHCGTDSKLMSSLSDPMLPSGGTDLIGSSSDVEPDKSTPHDSEHDTDITTADIGESAN